MSTCIICNIQIPASKKMWCDPCVKNAVARIRELNWCKKQLTEVDFLQPLKGHVQLGLILRDAIVWDSEKKISTLTWDHGIKTPDGNVYAKWNNIHKVYYNEANNICLRIALLRQTTFAFELHY